MAMGVFGKMYPACARAGDRAPARSVAMMLYVMCSFFASLFTAEGVSYDVVVLRQMISNHLFFFLPDPLSPKTLSTCFVLTNILFF